MAIPSPHGRWRTGASALAIQKALAVTVVLAPASAGFRVVPRTTLALLAGLSALVAVAVANNVLLFVRR